MLLFPIERAAEVMHAWHAFTKQVPDSVTTSFRFLQIPDIDGPPPFLRGRTVVVIDGAVVEDEARGAELMAPLRELGPEIDTFAMVPPVALSHIHMDPPEPVPVITDTAMVDASTRTRSTRCSTSPARARAARSACSRSATSAARSAATPAARSAASTGEYLYFSGGLAVDPGYVAAMQGQMALIGAALEPYSSGRHYSNFAERTVDPVAFYGEETYARLREIKAEVDPLELFRGNHEIPAAG